MKMREATIDELEALGRFHPDTIADCREQQRRKEAGLRYSLMDFEVNNERWRVVTIHPIGTPERARWDEQCRQAQTTGDYS